MESLVDQQDERNKIRLLSQIIKTLQFPFTSISRHITSLMIKYSIAGIYVLGLHAFRCKRTCYFGEHCQNYNRMHAFILVYLFISESRPFMFAVKYLYQDRNRESDDWIFISSGYQGPILRESSCLLSHRNARWFKIWLCYWPPSVRWEVKGLLRFLLLCLLSLYFFEHFPASIELNWKLIELSCLAW